jgi:hypothetical protein
MYIVTPLNVSANNNNNYALGDCLHKEAFYAETYCSILHRLFFQIQNFLLLCNTLLMF